MTLPAPAARKSLLGSARPRISPPIPARSRAADFQKSAKAIGISPWPWQMEAARYIYGLGRGKQWLYPEVAVVVARQNGKTELLLPHILQRLRDGRRILHAAQTRDLPRLLFVRLAVLVEAEYGNKAKVRRGAGQETIEVPTGGFYRITAASAGGPRGQTIDDLLLDEVRELEEDFVSAAVPTMVASANPQVLYLSNAGDDSTSVLNGIRARAGDDPALAYLEWSAAPELTADDPQGWLQANPAIGHRPGLIDNLARLYRSHRLAGTLASFETENLCRWVATTRERLVDEFTWTAGRVEEVGRPSKPALGVSMDPAGRRASVVMAWQEGNEIALRLVANVSGEPVDIAAVGELVQSLSSKHAASVGYDPVTDAELAKFAPKGKAEAIAGAKYANASAQFVNAVNARLLRWEPVSEPITDDLTWTARKPDGEPGHFHAVRAKDDHPVTAALAAIRAVWLASGPARPVARVY